MYLPAANIFPPNCKSFPKMKLGKSFNLCQFFEVFIVGNPLLQLYKLCFVTFKYPSNTMKTNSTVVIRVDLRMRNYSVIINKFNK